MDHVATAAGPRRRGLFVPLTALVVLAALTGAACAGESDDDNRTNVPVETTEGDDSSATTTGDEAGGDGEAGPDGGEDASEVLASSTGQHPTDPSNGTLVPLRIDVTSLERDGDLVRLELTIYNEADPSTDPFQPYSTLADPSTPGNWDMSGTSLVDGEGQRAYLAILDENQRCLCTDVGNLEIAGGASLDVYVAFGGLPEDLDAVDVTVPGFAVAANVPISG